MSALPQEGFTCVLGDDCPGYRDMLKFCAFITEVSQFRCSFVAHPKRRELEPDVATGFDWIMCPYCSQPAPPSPLKLSDCIVCMNLLKLVEKDRW